MAVLAQAIEPDNARTFPSAQFKAAFRVAAYGGEGGGVFGAVQVEGCGAVGEGRRHGVSFVSFADRVPGGLATPAGLFRSPRTREILPA
ncbi:hypothetical protein [Alloactinosynnema sp. L-07]|nr:hypothetical protein [Alloactinosynnema sp. L-07]